MTREPFEILTETIVRRERILLEAKDAVAAAQRALGQAEHALIEAMESGSVPEKFSAHGYTWGRSINTYVRPANSDSTQRVVDWIAENGGGSLIKNTMHAASRDKFLRELLLDDDGVPSIPPDLQGLVKVDEVDKVTKRSS